MSLRYTQAFFWTRNEECKEYLRTILATSTKIPNMCFATKSSPISSARTPPSTQRQSLYAIVYNAKQKQLMSLLSVNIQTNKEDWDRPWLHEIMVRTFSEVILIRPLCHESKILVWTIFVALAGEALAKQISLKDQDQPSFELGCESLCEDEVTTGLATSLTVSSGSQRLSSPLHTFYFLITPPAPSPKTFSPTFRSM